MESVCGLKKPLLLFVVDGDERAPHREPDARQAVVWAIKHLQWTGEPCMPAQVVHARGGMVS